MKIRQLCSPEVVSASQAANVGEIAQLMRDRHVGAVVILAAPGGRSTPIGIITDRDIVRAQLEHAVDLTALAALAIMSADPLVLRDDTEFNDAIERMALRGVRRAPVVNAQGELVGLISVDDLVSQVARQLESLSRLLGLQPTVEGLSASRA